MRALIAVFVVLSVFDLCCADGPYVGTWNYTYSPHASDSKLCIKLQAGIRLDIAYQTTNGSMKTVAILSNNHTVVGAESLCGENATTEVNETLALKFNDNRTLLLYFTRDPHITKDDKTNRWQLYNVEFDFVYDTETFPDSQAPGSSDKLSNTSRIIPGISTGKDRSFSCSRTGTIVVADRLNMTLTGLRIQAFMTGDDFSAADHCAADQETTDLIPIIIGAALAALVIIVLIAYLIGRARANTPAYDNMK